MRAQPVRISLTTLSKSGRRVRGPGRSGRCARLLGLVVGVVRVQLLDAVWVFAHVSVRRVPVRRRGEDQRAAAAELVEQSAAELTCVTADRDRRPLGALRFGMEHVAGSKRGPAWLELDSECTPVEMDSLDERGADAAHWVEHEVARLAVAADRFARERG